MWAEEDRGYDSCSRQTRTFLLKGPWLQLKLAVTDLLTLCSRAGEAAQEVPGTYTEWGTLNGQTLGRGPEEQLKLRQKCWWYQLVLVEMPPLPGCRCRCWHSWDIIKLNKRGCFAQRTPWTLLIPAWVPTQATLEVSLACPIYLTEQF